MSCVAGLARILARLASIDASFFVASSEASQRCNSHPPDRQLAHETRASLRVFPLRVVLVSTVAVTDRDKCVSLQAYNKEPVPDIPPFISKV